MEISRCRGLALYLHTNSALDLAEPHRGLVALLCVWGGPSVKGSVEGDCGAVRSVPPAWLRESLL